MERYLESLEKAVESVGINSGDVIYIASDITHILREFDMRPRRDADYRNSLLNRIIDVFIERIGEKGTLMFPAFTWVFCKGKGYDIRRTRCDVGAFNNWVLENRKDFVRTRHPMYSFLTYGKDSDFLVSLDNQSAWGQDSPFKYLYDKHAKLVLFDVPLQRAFTFVHYVEQCIEVPYRYHKFFLGKYIDEKDNVLQRCYSQYVLDLKLDIQEYMPDSFLDDEGVTISGQTQFHAIKSVDLYNAFDVVKNDFYNNKGMNCYKFNNYILDWESGRTHDYEISDRLLG